MRKSTKFFAAALILLVAFVGTYFAVINLYYADLVNIHSFPEGHMPFNSSDTSEMWANQDLSIGPAAGTRNVARNTVLVINEPRPVRVENITFNPPAAIAERLDEPFPVASAKITVFPAELLEPNTTYNITAIIGNELVWWSFTTGTEPQQQLNTVNTSTQTAMWYALAVATITTSVIAGCIALFLRHKRRQTFYLL